MQPDDYLIMSQLEKHHWWYVALHERILKEMIDKNRPIGRWWDAGCGTGGFLNFVKKRKKTLGTGTDRSNYAINHAQRLGLDLLKADFSDCATWPSGSWDTITFLDSFYFIRGDTQKTQTLELLWDRLNPSGRLILHLPALRILSGPHDLRVGIDTRFTQKTIASWIRTRPWKIKTRTYRLFLLFPLILMSRQLGNWRWKITLKNHPNQRPKTDLHPTHPILNQLLLATARLENLWKYPFPFGSSLLVTLEKPAQCSQKDAITLQKEITTLLRD